MKDVLITYDYYAGGSIMPGRSFNSNAYRYGWNKGSEKDDEITGVVGSHYTTYFREFDTRLLRTWSIDPALIPWQSPYASMNNNPIAYNDPMGDKIIGNRKEKRAFKAREKANGTWKDSKKLYRDGLFKNSEKDLVLNQQSSSTTSINNAVITATPGNHDRDVNKNVDWITFSPLTETVSKSFRFGNRRQSFLGGGVRNRAYPNINVGNDFTSGLFGNSINDYLAKNKRNDGFQIQLDFISAKIEDVNTSNPATYSFSLNGNPWNLGFLGANGNQIRGVFGRNIPGSTIRLNVSDKIDATGIWNALNGHYDGCHGFLIRTTVTLRRFTNN
ncbi:MAG: hypothetical protein KFKLKKLM_00250 [Flavobacteriales bacterium]|nr:hypothetical protein [Flavobacteriales bacterium]